MEVGESTVRVIAWGQTLFIDGRLNGRLAIMIEAKAAAAQNSARSITSQSVTAEMPEINVGNPPVRHRVMTRNLYHDQNFLMTAFFSSVRLSEKVGARAARPAM